MVEALTDVEALTEEELLIDEGPLTDDELPVDEEPLVKAVALLGAEEPPALVIGLAAPEPCWDAAASTS